MTDDVALIEKGASPRGGIWTCHVVTGICSRVCMRMCMGVRAHVIREIMHLFQDNANSLIMHTL